MTRGVGDGVIESHSPRLFAPSSIFGVGVLPVGSRVPAGLCLDGDRVNAKVMKDPRLSKVMATKDAPSTPNA
jgi:hypothetical protein